MSERFRDQGARLLEVTGFTWLVVCPRCSGRAQVQLSGLTEGRLSCTHCGLTREGAGSARYGGPEDPIFGAPLWLTTSVQGHTLWAASAQHLDWLEGYLGARLRERQSGHNRSVASRLPRWLKEGRHRERALAGITRLRARLPEP